MTLISERPTVVAALPTPFDDSENLDLVAMEALARRVIAAGCDAIFVSGTTGEYPALSTEERSSLIEVAVRAVGPERVMAHVGSACARDSERLASAAAAIGVRDIAAANPYFLPADPKEQFSYFSRISTAVVTRGYGCICFRNGQEISSIVSYWLGCCSCPTSTG